MKNTYDVAVLGGGPGGYVAAIRAAQYGLKTALIEKNEVGGTCLNRGCIPTKAMLHSCEVLHEIKSAERLGIEVAAPKMNIEKLYSFKDLMVKKHVGGVKSHLKRNGVEVYKGTGGFIDEHCVQVKAPERDSHSESGQQISAEHIIIATGSRPVIPPIPGLEEIEYWTSTTLLEENRELPESMLIIGGGVIGTECATILNDLGVKVTILEMMNQLLPQMDAEVARNLRRALEKDGITIHTGVKVTAVSRQGTATQCSVETESGTQQLDAADLMLAAGRSPVTEIPGIESLPVVVNRRGIQVNRRLQTAVSHIFAIGDVHGKWQLAHAASADGIAAVDHIAGKTNHTNLDIVPSCIYTRPEIASVGITSAEAKERGYEVAEGGFPMAANGKATIVGDTTGFVKIVSDARSGELLGAQIVAPRATDMIAELTVAMSAELTVEELGAAIHPHPTVSESIMEALHDIEGLAIHKPPQKGGPK
ncbi:MAG: dihydrolipoyl dehydrogenase [Spirochaetia bacterium]|nr:dihydrolipoyl dehydrogenase [Spirochaetia bacterium]